MLSWQLPQEVATVVTPLALALDARQRERFLALVVGLLFAKGRRTVTSWLRAGGLSADFRACYSLVYRVGRRAERLAVELLVHVVLPRLALWLHTLVEVWAWDRAEKRLVDRSRSPWDRLDRRPSHADRRRALQRECLQAEYRAAAIGRGQAVKFRTLAKRLLPLAA